MSFKRLPITIFVLLGLLMSVGLTITGKSALAGAPVSLGSASLTPAPADPDAYKGRSLPSANVPSGKPSPGHLTHPCGGMFAEPPVQGLSPLAIAYVPGMCNNGYGDIGVWQADGHSYVVLSGFALRMFHIFNVDDPYNPLTLRTQSFLPGGTTSTSVFPFRQGNNHYISITMRGTGSGCGFFVYNVTDPANPTFVTRKQGTDWCTVHEHFVSTDANGDADYAWLAMSGESGSGYKVVVLDIHDLSNVVETGRYQRANSSGSIFVHDVTVIGNRVFLAHWSGGLIIHDKETLAHNVNPTPLNPIDSIRPSGFSVHHAWPTSDGNHVFIEDEITNSPSSQKIKMYNISNINAPYFETGIIGTGVAASNEAHNLKILPQSTGHDLLLVAWYEAGTQGFEVDTTGSTPIITNTISHQLRQTTDGQQNNAWGADYLPCTLRGQSKTCIYTGDLVYGLVSDALGYDASLDPYKPESQITDPVNNQTINSCKYTIRGTAHDYYSGLNRVEVSTDGGVTWQPAQGTTSWTYEWNVPSAGAYSIQSRGIDVAGNVQAPVSVVNVNTTQSCLITATQTPVSSTATSTSTQPIATATSTEAPATATTTPQASATRTATVVPTATICTVRFADVPASGTGSTFYSFITCLACRGIISGYPCGSVGEPCNSANEPYFRPGVNITRGQISKIVALAANLTGPVGNQIFEDVPASSTFYDPIQQLAGRGFMGGYPCANGTVEPCGTGNQPYFRPSANTTRGQLSKIVSNTAGFNDTPGPQRFSDVPSDSPFFVEINRLASRSIIGGYACGGTGEPCDAGNLPYFRPNGLVSRGQTTKIVANTYLPGCQTPAGR